jgi:hypothetical protein
VKTLSSLGSASGLYTILKYLNHFERSHESWYVPVTVFMFMAMAFGIVGR